MQAKASNYDIFGALSGQKLLWVNSRMPKFFACDLWYDDNMLIILVHVYIFAVLLVLWILLL